MAEVHLVVHGLHDVLAPALPLQLLPRVKQAPSGTKEYVRDETNLGVHKAVSQRAVEASRKKACP
jgi:hypothetical protein